METESRLVVSMVGKGGRNGECFLLAKKFLCAVIKNKKLMVVIVVNCVSTLRPWNFAL